MTLDSDLAFDIRQHPVMQCAEPAARPRRRRTIAAWPPMPRKARGAGDASRGQ
jgi:hypothetical protein